LPGETIGEGAAEQVLFQTPNESEHLANVSGSVEDWRTHVGSLCSGNSRLVLAVSCAFAGPSLSLVGAESGGVHFHGITSTGKSTALLAGGSVIGGGGRNGFVQSWRTTTNGLEAVAEFDNDLTLFLDELAQVDPREAAETAYLLGNGSGKSRPIAGADVVDSFVARVSERGRLLRGEVAILRFREVGRVPFAFRVVIAEGA
jgi:uncharacterized protein (DUF927 family)